MAQENTLQSGQAGFTRAGSTIRFSGRLDAENTPALLERLLNDLGRDIPSELDADLSKITYLDDFGAMLLYELKKRVLARQGKFRLTGVSEEIQTTLDIVNFSKLSEQGRSKPPPPGAMISLGEKGLKLRDDMRAMTEFLGDTIISLFHICRRPSSLRWGDTLTYMKLVGVDALPIVGLISFLLGLIMAFMSSVQLKQFGANIYVASLVGLSMTRELGPIMTCIIVAGRSGSAFAAEIGSKKISEEVDALSTMGYDITRFLVMPKVVATIVVVPILTLFSDLLATIGGLIVGVGMLELTPSAYLNQFAATIGVFDVALGVGKSAVFALLISWVGCYKGLRVHGGADAVGRATTSAVVNGIFLVIFTDAIAAVIERYWG